MKILTLMKSSGMASASIVSLFQADNVIEATHTPRKLIDRIMACSRWLYVIGIIKDCSSIALQESDLLTGIFKISPPLEQINKHVIANRQKKYCEFRGTDSR